MEGRAQLKKKFEKREQEMAAAIDEEMRKGEQSRIVQDAQPIKRLVEIVAKFEELFEKLNKRLDNEYQQKGDSID